LSHRPRAFVAAAVTAMLGTGGAVACASSPHTASATAASSRQAARAAACTAASSAAATPPRPAVPLQLSGRALLRVNQVGYVTTCPKVAWLMSRSGGRALHHPRFAVLRGGRVVERGRAGAALRFGSWWTAPLRFDGVRASGTYRLAVDGLRSPAIRVGSAAALYRPLADAALSYLQSQRDGPQVIPGTMSRAPSHLLDANAAVYALPGYRGLTLASPLTPTGAHVDASGGWFDAGDYLKFTETASFTDALLLFTLRSYPGGVSSPAALAAEARFGVDWLAKLWNPQQRSLVLQVGIGDGNGSSILGDHDLWRLPQADDRSTAKPGSPAFYATHRPVFLAAAPGALISPNLAGRVAADFGLCAQVFATSDPAYARNCLLDGEQIYDQADTHWNGPALTAVPGAYYSEPEWRDDMQFGATELMLGLQALGTTAGVPHTDPAYYLQLAAQWANAYMISPLDGQDSFNLYDVSSLADYDLIRAYGTPLGASILAQPDLNGPTDPGAMLSDRHDQLALESRLAARDPFGLANPSTNLDTVTHALGTAIEARLYDEQAGRPAFDSLSQQQLAWTFGANGWGSSFVVGAGSVFPHCLAAQIPNLSGSLNGRGRILAGAVVNGPSSSAEIGSIGAPDGYRPCPRAGTRDPFAAMSGAGQDYLDEVGSSATSEPTIDGAALLLLAAAQSASA
jgi:endoglucanase